MTAQTISRNMTWIWSLKSVLLLLGAFTLYWNVVATTRLSSTLVGRALDEKSATPPAPPRRHGGHERQKGNHKDAPRSVEVLRNFPRTIGIDGIPDPPQINFTSGAKRERAIDFDKHALRAWNHIADDENYPALRDPQSRKECVPAPWQPRSYPNCNLIHERDLHSVNYIASGGFNDVFRMHDGPDDLIIKMLSPGKKHAAGIPAKFEYSERNFDVVRRDALVLEEATRSPHVQPLHGYCGFSVVVPWADGGTLDGVLAAQFSRRRGSSRNRATPATRLRYALDAAMGLADAHDIGVVHADLTVKQYMVRDGSLELGDFNRGIFLEKNSSAPDTACTFLMTHNYGTTRAPEEYMHKPQTVAVDVWSLGSIIYHLLTGKKVWSSVKKNPAQEAVVRGELPKIDKSIMDSPDPADKVLMKALDMCYVYEPSRRATAREVASFLQKGWEELSDNEFESSNGTSIPTITGR